MLFSRTNSSSSRPHITTSGLSCEEKRRVQQAAERLGLGWEVTLSSVCTHVISNTVSSEKYRTAVAKRLPVLRKEWLLDSLAGGSVLLPMKQYLLPPLYGLAIVVSGTTFGREERSQLEAHVEAQGGVLQRELSAKCTHLVVDAARGEKYASCCASAELAHVQVVRCGWLLACLQRGVCVAEPPYAVVRQPEPCLSGCVLLLWPDSMPPARERELGAISRRLGATRVSRWGALVTHVLVGELGPTDVRALAAAAEAQPGVRVLCARWLCACEESGGRVEAEPYVWREREGKENSRPNGLRRTCSIEAPVDGGRGVGVGEEGGKGAHSAAAPLAPPAVLRDEGARGDGSREAGGGKGVRPQRREAGAEETPFAGIVERLSLKSSGCFFGRCCLLVCGRVPNEKVDAAVGLAQENGMKVLRDSGDEAREAWRRHEGQLLVLVPLGQIGYRMAEEVVEGVRSRHSPPRGVTLPWAVTLPWLEECLLLRKCVDPSTHPIFTPTPHELAGVLDTFKISVSQYKVMDDINGQERRLGVRLIQIMGGRYTERFGSKCTHLVCPHISGEKCDKALELRVPMVTFEWIYACYAHGKLAPLRPYLSKAPESALKPPPLPSRPPSNPPSVTAKPPASREAPPAVEKGACISRERDEKIGSCADERTSHGDSLRLAKPHEEGGAAARSLLTRGAVAAAPPPPSERGGLQRCGTVASAEMLLRGLDAPAALDECTLAPVPRPAAAGALTVLPSDEEGFPRRHVSEVQYEDPNQREQQERIRSRMLSSPSHDAHSPGADAELEATACSAMHLADIRRRMRAAAPPAAVRSASGCREEGGAKGGLFAALSGSRAPSGGGARRPLAGKTIALVSAAPAGLAARVEALGGQPVALCAATARPIPRECSAALVEGALVEGALDAASAELLCVLAAGLTPLRASYVDDAEASAGKVATPAEAHAWGEAECAPAVGGLLRIARRRAGCRAFEAMRVHVHKSAFEEETGLREEQASHRAGRSGRRSAAVGWRPATPSDSRTPACLQVAAILQSGGATLVPMDAEPPPSIVVCSCSASGTFSSALPACELSAILACLVDEDAEPGIRLLTEAEGQREQQQLAGDTPYHKQLPVPTPSKRRTRHTSAGGSGGASGSKRGRSV
ncbi:hypothetical protein AB1Y20_010631 [Prymnesium parvum]|uniref:BRCT domain-containing protein n=1 Tax=Prymnesium parvum TaxID=97485 RepID=A0AB34IPT9_PRYPA